MFITMSKEKRIEMVKKILNEHINDTLKLCGNDVKKKKLYAWGWRDEQTVGSNHGDVFYDAKDVVKTLVAFEIDWYLIIADNEEGNPTPCIHFY